MGFSGKRWGPGREEADILLLSPNIKFGRIRAVEPPPPTRGLATFRDQRAFVASRVKEASVDGWKRERGDTAEGSNVPFLMTESNTAFVDVINEHARLAGAPHFRLLWRSVRAI